MSIVLSNGLVLNSNQAITWTNTEPDQDHKDAYKHHQSSWF